MERKKRIDIEIMRIIAALAVIFNHTGDHGYFLYAAYKPNQILFWGYLFSSIFCKMAVPVFFMIFGSLMLGRDTDLLSKRFHKRIGHFFLLLLLWSFLYYLIGIYRNNEPFDFTTFLWGLYDGKWNPFFWFMYAYIGALLSLPIYQRLCKNMKNQDFVYLFALYAVFAMILPCAELLLCKNTHKLFVSANPPVVSSLLIYPLAGYFLSERCADFWNRKRILALWGANLAGIILTGLMTACRGGMTGYFDDLDHNAFVLLNAAAVFVTVQYCFRNHKFSAWADKCICEAGSCTFGIYLIHYYLIYQPVISAYSWSIIWDRLHIPGIFSAFVFSAWIFVLAGCIVWVLQRIPVLRNLVR